MGMAKSDFSQMRRSRSYLIQKAESFAQIDLDRSCQILKKNTTNLTKKPVVSVGKIGENFADLISTH